MDDPITDVVVVTSTGDCPHGYTIIKTTPCGFPANLWEKVFGGRSGERYICFTKRGGQNDTVVEDMIIPPPSQKYLRKGYRAIPETPDGEEPLRHKQLVLKRSKRDECSEAIVDIVIYRSKDEPAHSFRKLAKVNDLYICVRPAKVSSTSNNAASKPEPAVRIAPVEEKVQVNLEPVVESSPNVDALLDKMGNALSISPEPTEHRASPQDSNPQYLTTTTTYPQTITQSMPEPTSTYSSSQTTSSYPMPDTSGYASSSTQDATTYPGTTYSSSQTTSSYLMPDTSGYASSSTQGATTYPGTTYSSSQTTSSYSMPDTSGYGSSTTQGATTYPGSTYSSSQTTPSSYLMPDSNSYTTSGTQGATTYPGSGYSSSSYSNSGAPYSNSNTAYSNPSGQYIGANSQYPSANSQYSNTTYPPSTSYSSAQYSSNPYSNTSYSNASYSNASYSNPSNSYASAGYSGASYGGSSLPYSTNLATNTGAYSNQQYPSTAGYSSQPPSNAYPSQQYPTSYQSGGYPPAPSTNQSYGGYPPTGGGSYGGNQPAYPPTTKPFNNDIGFGF